MAGICEGLLNLRILRYKLASVHTELEKNCSFLDPGAQVVKFTNTKSEKSKKCDKMWKGLIVHYFCCDEATKA